jgi:hypothetical protein
MLEAADRDWLQEQALKVRASWARSSAWHGQKGLILFLLGAFSLAAIGGIFSNEEIGQFESTLCVMICIGLGGYYYTRENEETRAFQERRRIEESLERRGLKMSPDGQKVFDGTSWLDPTLSSSYRENEV